MKDGQQKRVSRAAIKPAKKANYFAVHQVQGVASYSIFMSQNALLKTREEKSARKQSSGVWHLATNRHNLKRW
jgi:hypothetical protein